MNMNAVDFTAVGHGQMNLTRVHPGCASLGNGFCRRRYGGLACGSVFRRSRQDLRAS
ncbi:MAG: hypothetical protein QJR06_06000 [Alicyclobacillaceae bacterium]|nr:hypothetical protein [Alicyclobacillaceae bacterium]